MILLSGGLLALIARPFFTHLFFHVCMKIVLVIIFPHAHFFLFTPHMAGLPSLQDWAVS